MFIKDERNKLAATAVLMCFTSALFYYYEYFLRVAPSAVTGEIMQQFNLNTASFGIMISYYYLAYVPVQLPVGFIMDKWGPRKILTLASACCTIGTLLFANSESLGLVKAGRFLVGFGSAFAYVGVLKIATIWLPRRYFALMAGLCTALGMLGGLSSEIVMTYITAQNITWQQATNFSAAAGVIITIILWLVVRDRAEKLIINQKRIFAHEVSFFNECKQIIKQNIYLKNGLIGGLTFLPLTAFAELWAMSYLEDSGLSKEVASWCNGMIFIGYGIGGTVWGKLSEHMQSRRKPIIYGSLISAILLCFLPVTIKLSMINVSAIILFCVAFFASAQVLVFAITNDLTNENINATGLAYTNFLVMLVGYIAQPLLGILIKNISYNVLLMFVPSSLFMATLLTLTLPETYKKEEI